MSGYDGMPRCFGAEWDVKECDGCLFFDECYSATELARKRETGGAHLHEGTARAPRLAHAREGGVHLRRDSQGDARERRRGEASLQGGHEVIVTKCGNCRYYAERPPELMDRAVRPGVCLKVAKAVSPEWQTPIAPCNSTCNLSHPRKPTHFRPKGYYA